MDGPVHGRNDVARCHVDLAESASDVLPVPLPGNGMMSR